VSLLLGVRFILRQDIAVPAQLVSSHFKIEY